MTTTCSKGCQVGAGLLHAAAYQGNQAIAAFLIEQGCDPCALDEHGMRPSHAAAATGQTAFLEWLLSHFPVPIDAEGPSGATALACAATHGQLEIVQLLIRRGANPRRIVGGRRMLSSFIAANRGHEAVAAYLREQEAAAEAAEAAEAAGRATEAADATAAALLEAEPAREQAKKSRKQQKKKGKKGRQQRRQQPQPQSVAAAAAMGPKDTGAAAAGGGGGGGLMAELDDFDDGAMDFGLDEEEEWPAAAVVAAMAGLALEQQEREEERKPAAPASAPAPAPPSQPRPRCWTTLWRRPRRTSCSAPSRST